MLFGFVLAVSFLAKIGEVIGGNVPSSGEKLAKRIEKTDVGIPVVGIDLPERMSVKGSESHDKDETDDNGQTNGESERNLDKGLVE